MQTLQKNLLGTRKILEKQLGLFVHPWTLTVIPGLGIPCPSFGVSPHPKSLFPQFFALLNKKRILEPNQWSKETWIWDVEGSGIGIWDWGKSGNGKV